MSLNDFMCRQWLLTVAVNCYCCLSAVPYIQQLSSSQKHQHKLKVSGFTWKINPGSSRPSPSVTNPRLYRYLLFDYVSIKIIEENIFTTSEPNHKRRHGAYHQHTHDLLANKPRNAPVKLLCPQGAQVPSVECMAISNMSHFPAILRRLWMLAAAYHRAGGLFDHIYHSCDGYFVLWCGSLHDSHLHLIFVSGDSEDRETVDCPRNNIPDITNNNLIQQPYQ